jgi:hypothetical protein
MRQQTILGSLVDDSTISQLQSENSDLRDLVVHLGNVLLRNVMRQLALRGMACGVCGRIAPRQAR